MINIENIFVCIAAPLLVAWFCLGKKYIRFFVLCFAGMGACLFSAYINTFFAAAYGVDAFTATTQISPVVEEIIKLLPMLLYLWIFEPQSAEIKSGVFIIAVAFETFENICYLIQNGASDLTFLLIRGFGTGAMHIICGAIVGCGLVYVWNREWLKIAGICGLIGAAISFHSIYNLLVAYGGVLKYIAYALPVVTMIIGLSLKKMLCVLKINNSNDFF